MASSSRVGRLTNRQIVILASSISINEMEAIAEGNMGMDPELVKNIRHDSKENAERFNRAIIVAWRNKNPGRTQITVSYILQYIGLTYASNLLFLLYCIHLFVWLLLDLLWHSLRKYQSLLFPTFNSNFFPNLLFYFKYYKPKL